MNLGPVEYMPFRARTDSVASIFVPCAHFGIGKCDVKGIQILQARVEHGVAITLSEPVFANTADVIAPKIILGHIDGSGDVADAVKAMLSRFGSRPNNLRGYIATGNYKPEIYDAVEKVLNETGVSFQTFCQQSQIIDFAVDLRSGMALDPSCLQTAAQYVPDRNTARDCQDFITGIRKPHAVRFAFSMANGCLPKGYFKTKFAPIANAPAPQ